MNKKWEPYDPQWLIDLAKVQIPNNVAIIEALSKCIKGKRKSKAYIHFVDPKSPNQPESEWQFEKNIILEDEKEGTIILDVLAGNRIGGVEFLKHLK